MAPKGPYRLCTVNTAPERAKRVVGRVIEAVKDEFKIIHVENAAMVEEVKFMCEMNYPDILFCASMWTEEESDEIKRIAREAVLDIKILVVPKGLHAKGGPDAVVEWVKEHLPKLLDK